MESVNKKDTENHPRNWGHSSGYAFDQSSKFVCHHRVCDSVHAKCAFDSRQTSVVLYFTGMRGGKAHQQLQQTLPAGAKVVAFGSVDDLLGEQHGRAPGECEPMPQRSV